MKTKSNPLLRQQCDDAIASLNEGHWGPIAELILKVRASRGWEGHHKNFTEWMSWLSERYQLTKARPWRYSGAGSYYLTLRERFAGLPELRDIPRNLSPETLEILKKIDGAAPEQEVVSIASQVLAGEMPVRKIRTIWASYRQAGEKSESTGQINEHQQFEIDALLALDENHAWTGYKKPFRARIYRDIGFLQKQKQLDAVGLVVSDKTAQAEVHAFEIKKLARKAPSVRMAKDLTEIDYVWLVTNVALNESAVEPHVGLIVIKDRTLEITRHAQAQSSKTAPTEFMKGLLRCALRA